MTHYSQTNYFDVENHGQSTITDFQVFRDAMNLYIYSFKRICILLFQVGFDAGDGVNFFNMPESQTPEVLSLSGNTYLYRIDLTEITYGKIINVYYVYIIYVIYIYKKAIFNFCYFFTLTWSDENNKHHI